MKTPHQRFTYEQIYSSNAFLGDWFYDPTAQPEDTEIYLSILAAELSPNEFDFTAGSLRRAAKERFGLTEQRLITAYFFLRFSMQLPAISFDLDEVERPNLDEDVGDGMDWDDDEWYEMDL